jgi:heme/copper-type cytochrome/quinol oxidase subunit 2
VKSLRAFLGGLIGLACICAGAILLARTYDHGVSGPTLTVRAVAHQWWWEFDYPSVGIKTSDVLCVPSATNVRLELVSADVIHSFWMIGMKAPVDIVPGATRQLDMVFKSPGERYGNCDSACGCGTVCMRFRVLATNQVKFEQWAARERLSRSKFKAPRKGDTPACALSTGQARHAGHNSPASHLQRLLDADGIAGSRRYY